MTSAPLASLEELAAWLDTAISNETRAELMLAAASAAVRSYKGITYLDEDGELIEDVPDEVKVVTLLVAERLLTTSPNTRSITLDGYSESYGESGGLLTDVEKSLLDGAANVLTSIKVTAPSIPTIADEWDQIIESDGS